MFSGDLEKIVNLLLSLCSRMSRIDRSLLALQREELTQEDTAGERVRQDRIYLSDKPCAYSPVQPSVSCLKQNIICIIIFIFRNDALSSVRTSDNLIITQPANKTEAVNHL